MLWGDSKVKNVKKWRRALSLSVFWVLVSTWEWGWHGTPSEKEANLEIDDLEKLACSMIEQGILWTSIYRIPTILSQKVLDHCVFQPVRKVHIFINESKIFKVARFLLNGSLPFTIFITDNFDKFSERSIFYHCAQN